MLIFIGNDQYAQLNKLKTKMVWTNTTIIHTWNFLGLTFIEITVVRRPSAHGCLIGIFKSLGGGLLHEY